MNKTKNLFQLLSTDKPISQICEEMNEDFSESTLAEILEQLLQKYDVKKADVINKAEINQIYGYQIFSGNKQPSRDKLISIAFGFSLDLEDATYLLRMAQQAQLYPRIKRDAFIIYAINNGFSVVEVNHLLFENGLPTL